MVEEVAKSGMDKLITAIGSYITGFVGWLGTVSTALLENDLFILGIAISITLTVVSVVVSLAHKKRRRR